MTAVLQGKSTPTTSGYRHDIDGLRAVAIVLVVVYHVWIGRVSGGVDVFLMISAFFLTGSFVRRIDGGQPLRIGSFLTARFRRLMPLAAVTIAGILIASWLLLPETWWPRLWRQGWTSLLYVQNWELAASGVDYYVRDEALPSPLQHFWSLSVQGQVFLLWPVVFVLGALIARRMRRSVVPVLAVLFGLVFAGSLAFSIVQTQLEQTIAYFDTRSRLWEFAAGSLVALALPYLRLPARLRSVLGWIGLLAIVSCGMVIDVRGGFPGYLALWPVLATALVIVAGAGEAPAGPGRWLSAAPVRAIGRDAYALYLVHWPILIIWLSVHGQTQATFLDGAIIIAASFVLARVLTRGIDVPLRLAAGMRGSAPRNLAVIAACVGLVAAVIVPWQGIARSQADADRTSYAQAESDDSLPAAATDVRGGDAATLLPSPIDLGDEWVSLDEACTGRFLPADEMVAETCTQTRGADSAAHVIAVIGDSHAEQMTAAVLPVAASHGWGVVSYTKGGCRMEEVEEDSEQWHTCADWHRGAVDQVIAVRPDAVVTMVTAAAADSGEERMLAGMDGLVDEFGEAGIAVVGIRDNPRSDLDLYTCALRQLDCDRPVGQALASENPAAELGDRITLVDFTGEICPDGLCPARIGRLAVYLDDNHLTWMFARTLAAAFEAQTAHLWQDSSP